MATETDTTAPVIAMALAMDVNRLIGSDQGMPWHIPGEQARFRQITLGKPIIMGRKTFESIGQALPGRLNIVVTGDRDWRAEDVSVAHDLDTALGIAHERATLDAAGEVVVIGGAGLCREAMPRVERFYLTRIEQAFEGDTWLDSFEETDWQEVERESPDPDTTGGTRIHYCVLERRPLTPASPR